MEREKIFKNTILAGFLFGLALWLCFYSNLFFKNTEQSFPIIAEVMFALLFSSFFAVIPYDVIMWYVKQKNINAIIIYNGFFNLIIFLSFTLVAFVLIWLTLGEYLIKNDILLLKISILLVILDLYPFLICNKSFKMMYEHKIV